MWISTFTLSWIPSMCFFMSPCHTFKQTFQQKTLICMLCTYIKIMRWLLWLPIFSRSPVDSYRILFKNKQTTTTECPDKHCHLMDCSFEPAVTLFLLRRLLSRHYPVPHNQRIAPLSCSLASIQSAKGLCHNLADFRLSQHILVNLFFPRYTSLCYERGLILKFSSK